MKFSDKCRQINVICEKLLTIQNVAVAEITQKLSGSRLKLHLKSQDKCKVLKLSVQAIGFLLLC